MIEFEVGAGRRPPQPRGEEVAGGLVLLALALGALTGALLLERPARNAAARPRAQLSAAVMAAPE